MNSEGTAPKSPGIAPKSPPFFPPFFSLFFFIFFRFFGGKKRPRNRRFSPPFWAGKAAPNGAVFVGFGGSHVPGGSSRMRDPKFPLRSPKFCPGSPKNPPGGPKNAPRWAPKGAWPVRSTNQRAPHWPRPTQGRVKGRGQLADEPRPFLAPPPPQKWRFEVKKWNFGAFS